MKYYAVRQGRKTGIYNSWAECKEQVTGYSGAVFKAFETEAAAGEYLLQGEPQKPVDSSLPFAYIDGSYSKKNNCYGWGGFINYKGWRHIVQGTGSNPEYLPERNIAGEIIGALQIAFKAMELGIKELNLYFDYAGIASYINKSWETKTPLAAYYDFTLGICQCDLAINFIQVSGHTGIDGNEMADLLAKEAVGARLRKKDIAALQAFSNN